MIIRIEDKDNIKQFKEILNFLKRDFDNLNLSVSENNELTIYGFDKNMIRAVIINYKINNNNNENIKFNFSVNNIKKVKIILKEPIIIEITEDTFRINNTEIEINKDKHIFNELKFNINSIKKNVIEKFNYKQKFHSDFFGLSKTNFEIVELLINKEKKDYLLGSFPIGLKYSDKNNMLTFFVVVAPIIKEE